METTQQDFLTEEISLEQAASGKRLANYLIDLASFYALLFVLAIVLGIMFPGFFDAVDTIPDLPGRLIGLILYGLYIALVEGISRGKTLGKIITGTRAVNEDGTPVSFGTGFRRGFIHAIPFCAFSALGSPCYPWQDQWTKTYVVDVKQSILPA